MRYMVQIGLMLICELLVTLGNDMRKTMRKAVKLEGKVQALSDIKVRGTVDERMYARRKLADGLSGRFQPKQRLGKCDPSDTVL